MHFREMVRENLLNVQNAKIVAEYPEVSPNLYIRVLAGSGAQSRCGAGGGRGAAIPRRGSRRWRR